MWQQCQSLVNLERTHGCSQFCFSPFFYGFKVFQKKEIGPTRVGVGRHGVSFQPVPPRPLSTVPRLLWMFPQFLMKDNKCSKVQNNVLYSFQEQ